MILFRFFAFIIFATGNLIQGFHFHSSSAVIQSVSHYPAQFKSDKRVQSSSLPLLKSISLIMSTEMNNIMKIVLHAPVSRKLVIFSHPVVLVVLFFIFSSKIFKRSWNISSNINQAKNRVHKKLLAFKLLSKKENNHLLNRTRRADVIELLSSKEDSASTVEEIATSILASQTIKQDIETKHLLIMEAERQDAITEAQRHASIQKATAVIMYDAAAVVAKERSSLLVTAKVEAEEKRQALLVEEDLITEDLFIPIEPDMDEIFALNSATDLLDQEAAAANPQEGASLLITADVEVALHAAIKIKPEEKWQAFLFEENSKSEALFIPIVPIEHEIFAINPATGSITHNAAVVISQEGASLLVAAKIQAALLAEENWITDALKSTPSAKNNADGVLLTTNTKFEALQTEEHLISGSFIPTIQNMHETPILKSANDKFTFPVVGIIAMIAPFLYMMTQ